MARDLLQSGGKAPFNGDRSSACSHERTETILLKGQEYEVFFFESGSEGSIKYVASRLVEKRSNGYLQSARYISKPVPRETSVEEAMRLSICFSGPSGSGCSKIVSDWCDRNTGVRHARHTVAYEDDSAYETTICFGAEGVPQEEEGYSYFTIFLFFLLVVILVLTSIF